jgi:hypothetical protein
MIPSMSVAARVTMYVPAAANECVTLASYDAPAMGTDDEAVPPAPKVQFRYAARLRGMRRRSAPPESSVLADGGNRDASRGTAAAPNNPMVAGGRSGLRGHDA